MSDSLGNSLRLILKAENLTTYGASQLIGAETDEDLKTIHRRWQYWLKEDPKTWKTIRQDLAFLGYEIQIKKVAFLDAPKPSQPADR